MALLNVADLTGGFGRYQAFLSLLVFLRFITLALMTNSGPLLAPEIDFGCKVPLDIAKDLDKPDNETMAEFVLNKCSLPLINGTNYRCRHFWFNKTETGITMTDSMQLICDRAYLRSTFQSAISLGVLLAAFIWGPISDQHGRRFVVKFAFAWSAIWAGISFYAQSFYVFTTSRALCTFGDVGIVFSMSLLMVETIPTKHRGTMVILTYTGWSVGVMLMPFIVDYFLDYKTSILFLLVTHIMTSPPLLLIGDSVRWLMVSGRHEAGLKELERINKWNGVNESGPERDLFLAQFEEIKLRYCRTSARNQQQNNHLQDDSDLERNFCHSIFHKLYRLGSALWQSYKRVGEFFKSFKLAYRTLLIVCVSFIGELFYMLFVLINSDIGEAKKFNYVIGFGMECLATLLGIIMSHYMSRRMSIFSTLLFIGVSCTILAKTLNLATISIVVMNLAKIAISNLTSFASILANETFPTTLRQTGLGLAGALASIGAVVAPFVRTELADIYGLDKVMLVLGVITIFASSIALLLTETKGVELPDDIDDMADGDDPTGQVINGPHGQARNVVINRTQIEGAEPIVRFTSHLMDPNNHETVRNPFQKNLVAQQRLDNHDINYANIPPPEIPPNN